MKNKHFGAEKQRKQKLAEVEVLIFHDLFRRDKSLIRRFFALLFFSFSVFL
jgi:hypothetical protein